MHLLILTLDINLQDSTHHIRPHPLPAGLLSRGLTAPGSWQQELAEYHTKRLQKQLLILLIGHCGCRPPSLLYLQRAHHQLETAALQLKCQLLIRAEHLHRQTHEAPCRSAPPAANVRRSATAHARAHACCAVAGLEAQQSRPARVRLIAEAHMQSLHKQSGHCLVNQDAKATQDCWLRPDLPLEHLQQPLNNL